MRRIGLALSGGGFRATLYHLGLVRFLREAGILPSVSHITSVSGGSIVAAHLVLNWDRYNGSLEEFDQAAAEILRFVQLDIRNRIVRRFPLAMPVRSLQCLALRKPNRQLTRTGLLEYHYEKYLYGDTCLFQLPERPRLHLMATNLSEGCLCAFTRDGLVMQRRQPGGRFKFDRVTTGLATVPMAVTASSAFPGFFPPLELQGQDVGADPGRFGRVAFTDGGVYDNLGVRMFRWMERSWMAREVPLKAEDLADAGDALRVLRAARDGAEDSPLRRLAQMLDLVPQHRDGAGHPAADGSVDQTLSSLWDVLGHENLAREPSFARLALADPDAAPILGAARGEEGEIEAGELLWLNRQLVDAAFRQSTGQPCFRSPNTCFDTVLVSDAGKQFKIKNARAGGLIATSLRATDIVMDRVWQLEIDTFADTAGFVFAPISRVVSADEDPTAPHPEVQRMTGDIRTDLDRFSPLEIEALVRHGYCVGRHACRKRPDLFGDAIPETAPWDPFHCEKSRLARSGTRPAVPALSGPAPETRQARTLQRSASRRIWSRLLDYRDWTSFLYVPLLVPILIVGPYLGARWYRQSQIAQRLIEGIAQSNQDYALVSRLLQGGPIAPFTGLPVEEAAGDPLPPNGGVEVLADMRVLDLRRWQPAAGSSAGNESSVFVYRRLRVRKQQATARQFVVRSRLPTTQIELRALNERIPTVLRHREAPARTGDPAPHQFEVVFDLSRVPTLEAVDLPIELMSRELAAVVETSARFHVDDQTGLLSCWLLLPPQARYRKLDVLRYPGGLESGPERVAPAYNFDTLEGQVLAFGLLGVQPDIDYEVRWDSPSQ